MTYVVLAFPRVWEAAGHASARPKGQRWVVRKGSDLRAVQTLAWEEDEVEKLWNRGRGGLPSHAKELGLYFL